jgi:hypothetical protein
MTTLLTTRLGTPQVPRPALLDERAFLDEASARRALLDQTQRLERQLAAIISSAFPRVPAIRPSSSGGEGPRLLDLGELEQIRDDLAARVRHAQEQLDERGKVEELNRRRVEEMVLEPERHRWVRISREDIGERGCGGWHATPGWGLLGLLRNWWRVRISSGCP